MDPKFLLKSILIVWSLLFQPMLNWILVAGATQACGTGACAVVVAAVKEGHSERVSGTYV